MPCVTYPEAWVPDVRGALFDYKETEAAARALRVQLQSVEVSRAEDIARAFSAITEQRAQAFIVQTPNPVLFAHRRQLVDFARKRVPAATFVKTVDVVVAAVPEDIRRQVLPNGNLSPSPE